MFDRIVHADWSKHARKRWQASARKRGRTWIVDAPVPIRAAKSFFPGTLAGFDFPIGVPAVYGCQTEFETFLELLEALRRPEHRMFFEVARTPSEISLARPFYPFGGQKGARQGQLCEALGVSAITDLLRRCDHRSKVRSQNACSLFWTLGANQVGRAALSGWREMLLERDANRVGIWPFQGALDRLSSQYETVICETYPAEAYGLVGIDRGTRWSKRKQPDRAAKGAVALMWGRERRIVFADEAERTLMDGFGSDSAGEDRFDAMLGLLSMIAVVDGLVPEGAPEDRGVRTWEGWILGRPTDPI